MPACGPPLPAPEPTLGTASPWPWQQVSPLTCERPVNSCRIGYRLFTGKSNPSWKSGSPVGPRFITEV